MNLKKISEDVVELFKIQAQQTGDVRLRSIKVSLPIGTDSDKVAEYIVTNYPQYKAHSKGNEGANPILAIGHR